MRIRDQELPITNTFKNKIIHQYDTEYIFNDVIPYYFDDIDVFNLFMKDAEKEPKYTGKMVDCEVGIECVSVEYEGKTYKGRDIVMNYVKNVGGTVNRITDRKAYITIPTDAPYFNELQYVIHYFYCTFERISGRYDLEYKEGKIMPRFRKEYSYSKTDAYDICTEMFISIVVIVFSLLLML